MKMVTSTLAKDFVCKLCVDTMEGIVEPGKEIFLTRLSFYLGNRLKVCGGREATIIARTRFGEIKFRECREFHYFRDPNRVPKMKIRSLESEKIMSM